MSAPTLEQIVKPQLRADFVEHRKKWLSWDKFSNRTPGLFKLEMKGHRAIALCSKCYIVEGETCKCDKNTCPLGTCPKKTNFLVKVCQ